MDDHEKAMKIDSMVDDWRAGWITSTDFIAAVECLMQVVDDEELAPPNPSKD